MTVWCDGWSKYRHQTDAELVTVELPACKHCGDCGDEIKLCPECLEDLKRTRWARIDDYKIVLAETKESG